MTPSSCSVRIGRKARVPLTTPPKLIRRSHSSSSGSAPRTGDVTATPALLNTAASGAVSHSRTSAAKRSWAAASATSSTRVSTGPGSDRAVSFTPVSLTSAMATGEPDRDSRCARLRPMPEAAPVITTGRPLIVRRCRDIGTPSQAARRPAVRASNITKVRRRSAGRRGRARNSGARRAGGTYPASPASCRAWPGSPDQRARRGARRDGDRPPAQPDPGGRHHPGAGRHPQRLIHPARTKDQGHQRRDQGRV